MPLKQMSFRPKPSYFERDGPVCTQSASSFCRNPLRLCNEVPPPIRKNHTDRVLLSSACESGDQACEPLDQACRCLYIAHLSDMFDTQFNGRIQTIRIRLHTFDSAFDMLALMSHRWAVCRRNRVFC